MKQMMATPQEVHKKMRLSHLASTDSKTNPLRKQKHQNITNDLH